jgi:LacI family transcriptional regulator
MTRDSPRLDQHDRARPLVRSQRQLPARERDRIAKELQLSPRTVKRALEGSPNVSAETLANVVRERERLGFGSPPAAIVGLIVSDFRNPFFVELAESLETRLAQRNIQLIIATSTEYERREELHIQWMLNMRASGIFYCQNPPLEDSLHNLQSAPHVSVVLVDIEREGMDAVLSDSGAGIERAVAHLAIENQHQRIGFLAGPPESSTAVTRRKAFERAIREHHLDEPSPLILTGDYTFESGKRAALELAKKRRQGIEIPSAFVSANDLMAIGLIKGLNQISADVADLRVPDHISVVGFDNIATSSMISPELSSIDQRVDEIAERAVRLMIARLEGRSDMEPIVERVTPELRPRQSVSRYRNATSSPANS